MNNPKVKFIFDIFLGVFLIIMGLLFIGLGIFELTQNRALAGGLALVLGVPFLIVGIIQIIFKIKTKKKNG